jgi:hypothetical protein
MEGRVARARAVRIRAKGRSAVGEIRYGPGMRQQMSNRDSAPCGRLLVEMDLDLVEAYGLHR